MRISYVVLLAAAVLAAWYPYVPGGGAADGNPLTALLGPSGGAADAVLIALPFFFLGLIGQVSLPPARSAFSRLIVGMLLAAIIAAVIDVAAPLLGSPLSGAFIWQMLGVLLGAIVGLLPFVRRRLEAGWAVGAAIALALLAFWLLVRFYPYEFDLGGDTAAKNLEPLLYFPVFALDSFVRQVVLETAAWLIVVQLLTRVGPERLSSIVLLAFAAAVMALQTQVAGSPITVGSVVSVLLAALLHGLLLGWLPGRSAIYALVVILALGVVAVWPLALRTEPVEIAWRPFEALLFAEAGGEAGAMLLAVFVYVGLVWLLRQAGFGGIGSTLAAVLALVGLEAARLFMDGRPPDPGAPLIALMAGIGLAGLHRRPQRRWLPDEASAAVAVAPAAVAAEASAAPAVYDEAAEAGGDEAYAQEDELAGYDAEDLEQVPGHTIEEADNSQLEPVTVEEQTDHQATAAVEAGWAPQGELTGGELAYDDAGAEADYGSTSGYVPEDIVEEEELWHEEEVEGETEDWTEPEAEPVSYSDEPAADTEYSQDDAPGVAESGYLYDGVPDAAEALVPAPLTPMAIVLAVVRFVAGIAVLGGALVGLHAALPAGGAGLWGKADAVLLVLLAFVALAVALSAAAIGRAAAVSRAPILVLAAFAIPGGVAFVFIVDILLGEAWLKALVGNPGIFDGIVNFDFAGEAGKALLSSIPNRAAMDALEMLLRGAAAFMLMVLPLAAFVAIYVRMTDFPWLTGTRRLALGAVVTLVFLGSMLPWFALAKVMLFDTPFHGGLTGDVAKGLGAYSLLLLLVLWGWNAAWLGRPLGRPVWRSALGRVVGTLVALPAGFVLAVFAFQRADVESVLVGAFGGPQAEEWLVVLGWAMLQLAVVLVMAFGCRVLPARRMVPAGPDDRDPQDNF